MKTLIYVVMICVSIIFGLSKVSINQTQYQQQTQQQVQRNDNIQIIDMGSKQTIASVVWVIRKFEKRSDYISFVNHELNYYQQKNMKVMMNRWGIVVTHPIINTTPLIKTNFSAQTNYQTNVLKFSLF